MRKRWMIVEDIRNIAIRSKLFEVYYDRGWLFRNWYYMKDFATLKEAEDYIDKAKDAEFYGPYPIRLRK